MQGYIQPSVESSNLPFTYSHMSSTSTLHVFTHSSRLLTPTLMDPSTSCPPIELHPVHSFIRPPAPPQSSLSTQPPFHVHKIIQTPATHWPIAIFPPVQHLKDACAYLFTCSQVHTFPHVCIFTKSSTPISSHSVIHQCIQQTVQ
jgi:hypothetical protein